MPVKLSVAATVNEASIKGQVLVEGAPQDAEFAFYLMAGAEPVQRTGYDTVQSVTFDAERGAEYWVKAFMRYGSGKVTAKSDIVWVPRVTAGDLEASGLSAPLKFAPLTAPHQDIALIVGRHEAMPGFADELGLHFTQLSGRADRSCCTLSTRAMKSAGRRRVLFSGSARGEGRLILGQDDLRTPEEVTEEVGEFILLTASGRNATIRTDYFGIAKLFVFRDGEHVVLSNRYHLLLAILQRLGKRLTLDKVKMAANFAHHGQVLTQAFCSRMDIARIRMVPAGHFVTVEHGQVDICRSAIRSDIAAAASDDGESYDLRLRSAAEEITDNLKIALEHERFRSVRVDVTAGLDARMVFGALSRLPEFASKVRIHTADVAASPQDLPISLALTASGPWTYDDIPRTHEGVRQEISHEELTSLDLGTYYGHRPVNAHAHLDDTLRVSGFYGKVTARPYYARSLFGKVADDISGSDLIDRVARPAPPVSSPAEINALQVLLIEEFAKLPGQTALEKWDLHYLVYRNGLHCSDRWLCRTLAPSWGPLQSKELFRLKCATFHREGSIKLQLDLINELNPELARIPFGREKDNRDRAALAPRLQDPSISYMTQVPEVDRSEFDHLKSTQNSRTQRLNPELREEISDANRSFIPKLRVKVRAAAQLLADNGILKQQTVDHHILDHFASLSDLEFYSGRNVVLVNKLLDAATQIQIVQASQEQSRHQHIARDPRPSFLRRLAPKWGLAQA